MQNLSLEGTSKTPTVNFDSEKGLIELEGRSIPENSHQYYDPLLSWLDEYSANPVSPTTVNLKLEYFNTSSSKCILDIFKKLQELKAKGIELQINWYYETDDDDMKETGEDYQEITELTFNMIEEKELFGYEDEDE